MLGDLESDKESDRRLCKVSELVDIQSVETKVGDLVYQAAILGAHTKLLSNVEIGAATIHESAARLSFRSSHNELLSRIEDQCPAAAQHVWPNASQVNRNARNQGACHFVKIRLQR